MPEPFSAEKAKIRWASVDLVVHTEASNLLGEMMIVNDLKGWIYVKQTGCVEGAKINIKVFDLERPSWREHPFQPAASSPPCACFRSGRDRVLGDLYEGLGIGNSNIGDSQAAGAIDEHAWVDQPPQSPAKRGEPLAMKIFVVLFVVTNPSRREDCVAAFVQAGILDVGLSPQHERVHLPAAPELAATGKAGAVKGGTALGS